MASSTCVARTKHRLFKPGCLCFDDDSLQMALKSPKGCRGQVFFCFINISLALRERETLMTAGGLNRVLHNLKCIHMHARKRLAWRCMMSSSTTDSITHTSASYLRFTFPQHMSQNAFTVTAFQPRPESTDPLAQRAKYRWKLRETAASQKDPSAVHKCTYKQKITVRDVHHPCCHVTKAKL